MNDKQLVGPWVRRFLLEHLVAERNLSGNTQASYRDTLTLLLPFASAHVGHAIDRMTVAELGFDGVEPAATGRPSYHPSVLLKLYIYAYLN